MKTPLLLFVTVLSLLNPIIASPIDPDSNASSSLEARGPGFDGKPQEGGREGKPVGEPIKGPPVVVDPGTLGGTENTDKGIKARMQKLPGVTWTKNQIIKSKIQSQMKAARGQAGQVNDGTVLYLKGTDGKMAGQVPLDNSRLVGLLEEVPGSKGTMFTLQMGSKYTFTPDEKPSYRQVTLTRQQAIEFSDSYQTFVAQWLPQIPPVGKRDILQTMNSQPNATQEAADTFEQYLETLGSIQSLIGTLIAPVLSNITTLTNSSFIHQMAQSIYYDLTGSTVTLVGPFNNGISFIGKQSTNSSGQVWTALETVYTNMWFKAVNAANTTGLLAEQAYLTSSLYTSDKSVYPPGFTTLNG